MVKLDNERGTICISTDVITWLAGDAATRCFGVKGMAGRSKNDGIAVLLRRESMSKGVSVHFPEEGGVDIELHIVVDHGVNITALGRSIIGEVGYKVRQATGVTVNRVDVYVDSMLID